MRGAVGDDGEIGFRVGHLGVLGQEVFLQVLVHGHEGGWIERVTEAAVEGDVVDGVEGVFGGGVEEVFGVHGDAGRYLFF